MLILFDFCLFSSRLQDEPMETSENHEHINNHDGTTTPVHIDFEKNMDLPDNHHFAESELPMMVEEIQGYSDEKLVRCNNIIVSHA